MYTKEETREHIKKLANSFESKLDFIKNSGQYKEAQIEDEFIKPLFKYLNWNTSNEGISNILDREFIVQAKGRNGKEPDYLLQLDQKPKFYIEAKHTKYYLGGKVEHAATKERTDYIWQAYTYSYSTQSLSPSRRVDFVLLTDFEEFRFFDCTFPVKDNSILNNYCVIDWTYKDYIAKFDDLWNYFEKENVRRNSLAGETGKPTLYLNEKKIKANRIPPDKAFLNDLDNEDLGWRITLAKDIKKYQPEFSSEFITQSVQLILDRFIFIKVLSDREIEEEIIKQIVDKVDQASSLAGNRQDACSTFELCKDIFQDLDNTYNGSIFSKRAELDGVKVGNKTLLTILKDFLPENSRYNFKVIPVEILGTIYEQFLGKVVTTTDKRAKIEYKAEVRKAGGVYYTPDYIVNYIIEKTVGEKLKECKTIDDLLKIKICDPACGSGSFLIAAYDVLIQWTINYYKNKKLSREEQKVVYTDSNGEIRLTSKIKRDILRSCIYGVDIDAQAVEVTKMSLSLKALENTTHYEVHNEKTLFHTTILPPLEGNIKCGNSLIGTDFYKDKDISLFKTKEIRRINIFNWKKEFPKVFNNELVEDKNGFDIVIGNPPYRMYQPNNTHELELTYYKEHFGITNYKIDSFHLFIQKSIQINNNSGYFGYIVPSTLLNNVNVEELRKWILDNCLIHYLNICNEKVFLDADVHSLLIITQKSKLHLKNLIQTTTVMNKNNINRIEYSKIDQTVYLKSNGYNWNLLLTEKNIPLIKKIQSSSQNLGDFCKINRGLVTGSKEKYYSNSKKSNQYKEILIGGDIHRYYIKPTSQFVLFEKPKGAGGCWDEDVHFAPHKIVIRQIGDRPIASFLDKPIAVNVNIFTIMNGNKEEELYILSILNSKVIKFFWKIIFSDFKTSFPQVTINSLKQIPIALENKVKNFDSIKKSLVLKTSNILLLNHNLSDSRTEVERISVQRQIHSLDDEIDSIVYELYDLTEDEIKMMESQIE